MPRIHGMTIRLPMPLLTQRWIRGQGISHRDSPPVCPIEQMIALTYHFEGERFPHLTTAAMASMGGLLRPSPASAGSFRAAELVAQGAAPHVIAHVDIERARQHGVRIVVRDVPEIHVEILGARDPVRSEEVERALDARADRPA